MSLFKKLSLAAAGLSLAAVLGGCTFERGNEKVSFSMFILPPIAGSASVKHDIYEDDTRERVYSALDSNLSIFLGSGTFEMKVHGEDRKFIGRYEVRGSGKNIDKFKTRIYDSEGKLIEEFAGVPSGLPTEFRFSTDEWIDYRNFEGDSIDYVGLSKRIKEYIREKESGREESD